MKTWPAILVCCVVFLAGCWILRPARYQIAHAPGSAPVRLDTRTGEAVWLTPTGAELAQR